jgi:hypothetical protein
MTALARGTIVESSMQTPLSKGASWLISQRRELATRIEDAAAAVLDPRTTVERTMKGPTVCCPGRIRILRSETDADLDLRLVIHHEGTETIVLKAKAPIATSDIAWTGVENEDHAPDADTSIQRTADALSAFAVILRNMDDGDISDWNPGDAMPVDEIGAFLVDWILRRDAAKAIGQTAVDVLCTLAQPRLPSHVRLTYGTPFSKECIAGILEDEERERLRIESDLWRSALPKIVRVDASYGVHGVVSVGGTYAKSTKIDPVSLMRGMRRLRSLKARD